LFALFLEASASLSHSSREGHYRRRNAVVVRITQNDKNNPPGKLADAEVHFTEGALEGMKLIGFAVWERRTGGGRNVTFPARQYSVNGERRTFSLLRPANGDATKQDRIREMVLQAYADFEQGSGES
jgi:hypothetical protein